MYKDLEKKRAYERNYAHHNKKRRNYLIKWRKDNHERISAWGRKYWKKNKKKITAYKQEWEKNNKERRAITRRQYRLTHREEHNKSNKIWWKKHTKEIAARRRVSDERLRNKVFEIIPNRCYYESEYCLGELQWDHRHGDGKKDRVGNRLNRRQLLNNILNNPDRWLRLCERHNKMKVDMSKELFEAMIAQMAQRIKMKRDVQVYRDPEELV